MKNEISFETKRLKLRLFKKSDLKKVFQMSQEEGIRRWLSDQYYKNQEKAAEVINFLIESYSEVDPLKKPFVLGIELKKNKELIGHIGLSPVDDLVEVGYAVEEKYQGAGYATEAVKVFSAWAQKELNLEVIWGIVEKDNSASAKVLAKAGYLLDKSKINMDKDYYSFV
ncbi:MULTISPECIES: GNAT family N-acetyltransferase [Halanaerobium]|jgi:ribosomal-protein-alanine N-acetyltransferase|uniref:Ribosomal-protein-alanine N-acetyltransferase n=1 Tax=Halanaerobium kushneri TaxID=56779 RepID=A0A1N7A980_9FIRM|nr:MULTISPECIES: GNAT family N-acetyltransferase [Halanaerobium]RCW54616.1 ribosomal-protein-alanine N-acetyltransferase [Halanaerobium sp. ST460_2HS_T2]SIR35675.1 ribosomal-protein-alanine N-acetyltransferase [Halanaerobium kushneri]